MPLDVSIVLSPEEAADINIIRRTASNVSKTDPASITGLRIIRRSIDARQKKIKVNLSLRLFMGEESAVPDIRPFRPLDVRNAREVYIAGAGPAGLFAALSLIESGLKPVILERGKDVSARKKDIALISREQKVDPDSNYCFGEGGAGTYSDGKLYTRSKKRGDNSRVLELLYLHGASENILYEAHPHIGTDKLPGIIRAIRQTIIDAGGVIMMQKKLTGLLLEYGKLKGFVADKNEIYSTSDLILATGHSARDIYSILSENRILLESKPFAMGVRVEHPQGLINRIQYHGSAANDYLPAASYNLVRQVGGRGVYSFCMCPGGFIVPSATSQEEVVVNGMSPSGRNSPYANSGIVVEIQPADLKAYEKYGPLAGLQYQMELEKAAWINGGRSQHAPAQRLTDFIEGRSSGSLPRVSYFPGVTSSDLNEWLPAMIGERLREGFKQFGSIMRGFVTSEAVILGAETRTSSPVRIPRDPLTLEHPVTAGIYPAGEGSGYAGGIVSSAVDGMKAAEAVARKYS